MPRTAGPLLVLAALAAGSCDDPPQGRQGGDALTESAAIEARRAAEEQVRARLRILGELRLRAVQVHRQQIPGSLAVCGQVNPTGAASDPFIPWVAVVALGEGKAARTELVLGASNPEASRVSVEMVDRCFDGGGPRTAQEARPLPPLPSDATLAAEQAAAASGRAGDAGSPRAPGAAPLGGPPPPLREPLTASTRAARQVTTTPAHPVNVRGQPGGGGGVVRVVPRASTLRVFGEAPGGWLQVGEEQPFGWVHGSMLER
jgi:hypothetical protein